MSGNHPGKEWVCEFTTYPHGAPAQELRSLAGTANGIGGGGRSSLVPTVPGQSAHHSGRSTPKPPIEAEPRFAPCLVSIGGCTRSRPAGLPSCTLAMGALIGNRLAGVLWLRPLAPLPAMTVPNQLNFSDPLGFARPFLPSSPRQNPRLRAERIGGWTSSELLVGVHGNDVPGLLRRKAGLTGLSYLCGHFPRSNDRQDSTFPRESSGRAASAIFPPFFRVSGTLQRALASGSFFHRIRSNHQS